MNKYFLKNVEEMYELADKFANNVSGGEIYTFTGDLGAGKTTFVQGILKSLGAEGPFTSPTFTIVNQYNLNEIANKNIEAIYHIDAYRISSEDTDSIGFLEMLNNSNGLILIEWPEKIKCSIPEHSKNILFNWDENVRFVVLP